MSTRLISKTVVLARRYNARQPAAWMSFARDTVAGLMTTAHHAVMMLGIGAIAAWCVLFVKPEIADHLKTLSPFAADEISVSSLSESEVAPPLNDLMTAPSQQVALQVAEEKAVTPLILPQKVSTSGTSLQQERVTRWISGRYRVAGDATNMLVSAAYRTAKETKLDPLLILAVVAIESRFNPFAESPMGAQGLMQVMSKVHHKKFQALGGPQAALNPVVNIRVGAEILRDYVRRGGSLEAGLKLYVGAGNMETDGGYGARVLAEYNRLTDVAMGKKVPITAGAVSTVAAKSITPEQKPGLPAEAADVPAASSRLPQQHLRSRFTTEL